MKKKIKYYGMLLIANLIYSNVGVLLKIASFQEFLSLRYLLALIGAILLLFLYAILWQQIIRKIELSTAYIFKSTTIVFTMFFAYRIFAEQITLNNILGVLIIMIGVMLYASELSLLISKY